MLDERRNRRSRVTRSTSDAYQISPGRGERIVRNLTNSKGWPRRPERCWWKNTGRPCVAEPATATQASTGASRMSPATAPTMSRPRFAASASRLLSFIAGSASRLRLIAGPWQDPADAADQHQAHALGSSSNRLAQGRSYILTFVRELAREWERQRRGGDPLGHGEVARLEPEHRTVERLQMEWREVGPCGDPEPGQPADDAVTVDVAVEADHVDEPVDNDPTGPCPREAEPVPIPEREL